MEKGPRTPESQSPNIEEVREAKHQLVAAMSAYDFQQSIGIGIIDGNYVVAVRVFDESQVEIAKLIAEECIPDMPVDVRAVGPTHRY